MSSNHIILHMASYTPEDIILKELKKGLDYYLKTKDKEVRERVLAYCMMFLAKDVLKDQGLNQTISEIDQIKLIQERLSSTALN